MVKNVIILFHSSSPLNHLNTFGYVLVRFEDDEMERQENPIYGNICLEGGGRSSSQIQ